MQKIIVVLLCLTALQAGAQSLDAEERKIVKAIHASMPQTMQQLQQVVDINSGTLNVKGVAQVGEILGSAFMQIGFTTEWVTLPDSLKRAGHLVAYKKGKKGKRLFLIGHLDTVFEPDMAPNPFRIINDSTATGQGINDMKGGDVIILAALQALHQNGLLKDVTITAYFTGDEESAGKPASISRGDFIERARAHDVALGFETAQNLSTVATARRGASSWQLKVFARQGHSSGTFTSGYGAIYEATRIITAWREQLGKEKYLTFNPGMIAGGTEVIYDSASITASVSGKTNIISPLCIAGGDLRFLRQSQRDSARAKMFRIATTANLPGTSVELTFREGIPSMEPTKGNSKLVATLSKVSMDLGLGDVKAGDPGSRGAGDISYVAQYVDALDGLGAMGKGAHAPGETLDLKTYEQLIQRAAVLIYRLTR